MKRRPPRRRRPVPGQPDRGPAPRDEEPDAVVVARETVERAFLAAIQHLPPRQRAVLILRDVLDWSAGETDALLEVSVASVKSAAAGAHHAEGARRGVDTGRGPHRRGVRGAAALHRGARAPRPRSARRGAAGERASRVPPIAALGRGPGHLHRSQQEARRPGRLPVRAHVGERAARGRDLPEAPRRGRLPPRSPSRCCGSRTGRLRRSSTSASPGLFAFFGLPPTL